MSWRLRPPTTLGAACLVLALALAACSHGGPLEDASTDVRPEVSADWTDLPEASEEAALEAETTADHLDEAADLGREQPLLDVIHEETAEVVEPVETSEAEAEAETYDPCAHAGEPCQIVNMWGTCPGVVYCGTGTAICDGLAPDREYCDGLDNNCDGKTDEGFPDSNYDGCPDCFEWSCGDGEDGDGILDYLDNCPKVYNPDQANWDKDHLGPALGDNLGDACDPDDDNDGVHDDDDCEPKNNLVYPGNPETCDGKDNNCNGVVDEGFSNLDGDGLADCVDPDRDGDGFSNDADDCPDAYDPWQVDTDGNGVGDSCDTDDDGDGFLDEEDCAPQDHDVYPGAIEACDLIDNDCDGTTDEGWPDADGDGHPDACWPDEDDGDGVPFEVDNCPMVANPDQADWDGDGVGNECDAEQYLPVTIEEVLRVGYYHDTAAFLATLPPDTQGPEVLVDGATITVRWKAAVYEDCREPDFFSLTDEGSALRLRLVDTLCDDAWGCTCFDNDYVATVSASFEHAPGTYSVTVECLVAGFQTDCGPAQTFEITVE